MKDGFNHLFQKMNKKLLPAQRSKGIINRVNVTAGTVDVSFVLSPQTIVKNVPLNSYIDPSTVLVGDKCKIDFFDETNSNDMVVAYIYGRPFRP